MIGWICRFVGHLFVMKSKSLCMSNHPPRSSGDFSAALKSSPGKSICGLTAVTDEETKKMRTKSPTDWINTLCTAACLSGNTFKRELQWAENCKMKNLETNTIEAR